MELSHQFKCIVFAIIHVGNVAVNSYKKISETVMISLLKKKKKKKNIGLLSFVGNCVDLPTYMFKKSGLILYSKLLYKIGQDFLDRQQ